MIGMHGVSLYSAVRRSRMSDSMPIRTDATDDVDRAAATMWAAAGRVATRAPTKARRAVTAADARTAERTRVDATMNAMMAVGVEEPQAVCNRGGSDGDATELGTKTAARGWDLARSWRACLIARGGLLKVDR